MTFLNYVELLRQRFFVVLGIIVLTTMSALGISLLQGPAYQGEVRLRVRPPAPGSQADSELARRQEQTDMGTEMELVKSTKVANRAAELLGLSTPPEDLLDSLAVTVVPNTAVLVIDARADTPELATGLANAFGDAYLEVRRESGEAAFDALTASLTQERERAQAELDRLDADLNRQERDSVAFGTVKAQRDSALANLVVIQQRLQNLGDREALTVGFGEVIQPATRARVVRDASLARSGAFGVLVGVPLALAAVLLLDSLSQNIRSAEDAERQTGAPVLGTIPFDPDWTRPPEDRLAIDADPYSPVAEAYRTLRQNLAITAAREDVHTILVTSPGSGDGKSVTAASLAIAYADSGRNVAVVEADFRRPRVHRFLNAHPAPGVAEVLDGQVPLAEALQWVEQRLALVAAGTVSDRPDRMLAHADLQSLLESLMGGRGAARKSGRQLRPAGDRVPVTPTILLDAPPVLDAAEASELAAVAGGVVLVLRSNVSQRGEAAAAADQIRRAGGKLLGVVLIGAGIRRDVGRDHTIGRRPAERAGRPIAMVANGDDH